MPKPASDLYKVSNNPRAPRGGKALAVAASRVKKAAKTVSLGKKGRSDVTEVSPSFPPTVVPLRAFRCLQPLLLSAARLAATANGLAKLRSVNRWTTDGTRAVRRK